MATTTVHAQLIKYASNGDQTILYLENSGADVTVSRASNSKIPTSVTTVQKLVDALGSLAFSDGITVSGLTTSNFASGVITTDLTVSAAGKIADARALKTLNDKIATNASNISKLNSNYSEYTLLSANWIGSSAPFTYVISNSDFNTTSIYDIIINIVTRDLADGVPTYQISGSSKSSGSITLYAWGEKPSIDIPVTIVKRGGF